MPILIYTSSLFFCKETVTNTAMALNMEVKYHIFIGSWFRASYSKYVSEYPTRCNDNILVLLQDLYMFRLPAVPIIRSTILQLTVTAITNITLDGEISVGVWALVPKQCDVTNRLILGNL
jgi:hypothetical protein